MVPKMSAKKLPTPAEIDYQEEMQFAQRVLDGTPLSQYKYYKDYLSTINAERAWADEGAGLVIGSGPMPLSQILGDYMLGIDISLEAVEMANRVIKAISFEGKVLNIAAEEYIGYEDFDRILLTLEAGVTVKRKKKILDVIHSQMNRDAILIVRSSLTKQFVNSEKLFENFDVINSIDIFCGLSKSFILKRK